jgi:hydrophobe/amphiphile efflux-1 (HAE1) family protein
MISRFFIDRPIFAIVISILIILAGGMALIELPIAQFPDLVPPTVSVKATYTGASAEVVAKTVAAPLEQAISGVDDMIYMNSLAASDGNLQIIVTFAGGTDPDQATIDVNNRVQQALPTLPEDVRRFGVTVEEQSVTILQVLSLVSPGGVYDTTYLSNYALINILDDLKRIPGVGGAWLWGARDYSIRIWLKPDKMAQLGLTASDISEAVRSQNMQYAAGKLGQPPVGDDAGRVYSLIVDGRLENPEQFGDIILRANADGSSLRLKDVARVELGALTYEFTGKLDGAQSVPIIVNLSAGANAIATADAVLARMEELKKRFPPGVAYSVPYETTTFVRISIREVVKTLLEAVALVFLIVLLFLKRLRATLIPCLAVPVSIIGAFAGMYAFGFSINTLTLFGLVLAIGIVVDDAIIVIENVERIMRIEGLPPREATIKAMEQVTGPLIAIVLVLCAVFVPVSFLQGLAGTMYRQFAITISISVIISGFVALTLTPALTALLLKPGHGSANNLFERFDVWFEKSTNRYARTAARIIRHGPAALVVFFLMIGLTLYLFARVPGSLVPDEDQCHLFGFAVLDEGASLKRAEGAVDDFEKIARAHPLIESIETYAGIDLLSGAMKNNSASVFLNLPHWDKRSGPEQSPEAVAAELMQQAEEAIPDARFILFSPPAIEGMSLIGGFEGFIQNRGDGDSSELAAVISRFMQAASACPEIGRIDTTFRVETPQFRVKPDMEKAYALGVSKDMLFTTMQATFGSYYINDFNKYGRTFKVMMQSAAPFRSLPDNLREVFVRSSSGQMLPVSSLVRLEPIVGPDIVERFNVFPAGKIVGAPAPGYSSGQALRALEELALQTLPEGYTLSWIGSSYQEKLSGKTSLLAFILGLVVIFLILAAQYERWSLPLVVLVSVPFAMFGAIGFVWLRGLPNDVYFQIALVTLIGLSAKNAILIVEFALHKHEAGIPLAEAAIEAARQRFRPIVMTSMAFVLGCLPLALSSGAGSISRHSIGTGVVGGMLASTFIATYFVPLFFVVIMRMTEKLGGAKTAVLKGGFFKARNGKEGN